MNLALLPGPESRVLDVLQGVIPGTLSNRDIAARAGFVGKRINQERLVRRAIVELARLGLIRVMQVPSGGSMINAYSWPDDPPTIACSK